MSTRVVTGKVRFSYFSALTARKNEMNGKLIDISDGILMVNAYRKIAGFYGNFSDTTNDYRIYNLGRHDRIRASPMHILGHVQGCLRGSST